MGKESEMPDILVATKDGIAVVTLNRAETFNAVKLGMWRELADIFSNLAHDDSIRAIVLTGAGANFCVGADVTEFKAIRENREQSAAYEVSVDACSAAIAGISSSMAPTSLPPAALLRLSPPPPARRRSPWAPRPRRP